MSESSQPIRVLLVEDSELDAELLLDELTRDGLSIESLRVDDEGAYGEALGAFAPDLIVSDLAMPDFSGYRALQIARERVPRIPFMFVSGTMGEEAAVEALQGGATDYVLKHNLARLSSAVRRALAESKERNARDQAEQDLVRAQRYESLALLASGLSHDLRNVLQPISMGASMLLEDPRHDVQKVGQLIADCTQRGLDIVASMLSFAKGSRAAVERVSVRSLLDGLGMLLRGTMPRGVELGIELPDTSVEVDGNHTELQQCLLNLCLNAVQAMPDGGTLKLQATPEQVDGSFFEAGEESTPGWYLKVSIGDTGMGISEEVRAKLFTPFFTTKEQGTGLGLLSCRRILLNHKSFMRIASTPGEGTTFCLYLPLPIKQPVDDAAIERRKGKGERVLVVVEEASTLSLLRDTLQSNGYTVSIAQNGPVALQLIEKSGLPDLVVMEAQMNLMTGVRTLSALMERDYKGPVVMIARSGTSSLDEDLPPLHRLRFIEKPVNIVELLATVADELAAVR